MVKVRQELEHISGAWIRRPDLGDEARRLAAALTPVGNRRQRVQLIAVAEHRKKEVEVALQDYLAPWVRSKPAGKSAGAGCQACELVGAPGEFQTREIGRIDSLGASNNRGRGLAFVNDTKCNEVGNPTLR